MLPFQGVPGRLIAISMTTKTSGAVPLSQSRVESKHHYRFKYLKSDHWQNLRLEKMVSVDARCKNCGARDLSNDVHHLRYKKLYDVELNDLVVLCRGCHDLAHVALGAFRERIKNSVNVWKKTKEFMRMAQMAIENGVDINLISSLPVERQINIFWKVLRSAKRGKSIDLQEVEARRISNFNPWLSDRKTDQRYPSENKS